MNPLEHQSAGAGSSQMAIQEHLMLLLGHASTFAPEAALVSLSQDSIAQPFSLSSEGIKLGSCCTFLVLLRLWMHPVLPAVAAVGRAQDGNAPTQLVGLRLGSSTTRMNAISSA